MEAEEVLTDPVVQEEVQTETNDTVDVHEASVEELDAAIEAAQVEELEADSSEVVNEQPDTPPIEGQEPGAIPEPAQAEEEAPAYTPEQTQQLKADNERLQEENKKKELFIQHRGNELGTLRAELATKKTQLTDIRARLFEGLEDKFHENPVEAANDRDQIKGIDQQLQEIGERDVRATNIVDSQTFFLRNVDTNKVGIEDVAEILRADGLEERHVSAFTANPWEFTTPEALVQMGKRAEDKKNFVQADTDRHILAKHVMKLNAELEKAKGRPGQVMNRVQQQLNQSPPITAASTASPNGKVSFDQSQIADMSSAELDEALKAAGLDQYGSE